MTAKLDVGARLRKMADAPTAEVALDKIEQLLIAGAEQNSFLVNMGVVTLVMGPQGLGYYVASPGLLDTQDGIAMVESRSSGLSALADQAA